MEEQVLAVATVAARAAVKVEVWKAMATPAAEQVEEVMAVAATFAAVQRGTGATAVVVVVAEAKA